MGTICLIAQNIRHTKPLNPQEISLSSFLTMANKSMASMGAAHQKKIKAMSSAERKAYYKANAEKTAKTTKAVQAGLQFPVNRMRRKMRASLKAKVTREASIYMAAILEYCCAEVVELAGEQAISKKKKRIMPRHVMMAMKGDEEISKLVGQTTLIASAGSMPTGVHPSLKSANLPRKLGQRCFEEVKWRGLAFFLT